MSNINGLNDFDYSTRLEEMMAKASYRLDDLLNGQMGLRGYIMKIERPYADQNAMADIEGRPRPAQSYGGINKGHTQWWQTKVYE